MFFLIHIQSDWIVTSQSVKDVINLGLNFLLRTVSYLKENVFCKLTFQVESEFNHKDNGALFT